ncbi:MAG: peptidase S8 [Thermoleophilia bacterium]|nr:peptidase S8 [Thermoleophilia bacterium]
MKPTQTWRSGSRFAGLLAALTIVLTLVSVPAAAQAAVTQRLVVGFDRGTPITREAGALQKAGIAKASASSTAVAQHDIPGIGATIVTVPAGDVASTKARLLATPGVRYVGVDHVAHALWTPGDPRISEQWGLNEMGLPTAWDTTRGAGVTIAVVDTGVSYIHEDLWGKVDKGYDFVDDDADPMDVQGHGTHVSGIAAGYAGNGLGGAGVAPSARILAVRALDADGAGYYSWIANGITYAADHGAKVINLSLGGSEAAAVMEEAIGYASAKGAVVTCASGNDGTANMGFPAKYEGCLSVGSVNAAGARSSFSDYGSGLDVMAPGENILSSTVDGDYESWDGTSMATPYVSGLAALLFAQGLSRAQVINTIESTTSNMGAAGYDTVTGYGSVNAARAVQSAALQGPLAADAIAPTVSSVSVAAVTHEVSSTSTDAWKTTSKSGWKVVGTTQYKDKWAWKEVKGGKKARRIFYFRMKNHVVRRRIVTQKKVATVKKSSMAQRSVVVLASDNLAVDRVSLSIDGHWVGTDTYGADGWSIVFDCTAGAHRYTARAFDARDNGTSSDITQTVSC